MRMQAPSAIRRSLLALAACAGSAGAQDFELLRPSNTGIPGEEVRRVAFHPDGRLWVGARWPFWREGGVGIFDISADAWETHFNGETGSGRGPFPSEYINDFAFAADGTAWIATNNGLVRYDGTNWEIFNSSNTPMAFNKCLDVCIAPNGHVWVNNSDFNRGGDAVLEFDGAVWTSYRTGIEMPWDTVWQDLSYVFAASNGDVWVCNETLNGAARLRDGVWTLHGESIGRFDEMVEDVAGNVYFAPGLADAKLAKWDGSTMRVVYNQTDIMTLATDTDGAVYFGDWHGNVRRTYDGGASWQLFLTGLNQIFNVAPDPDGDDVWIGTIGALGRFTGSGVWVKDFNSYTTGVPDFFVDDLHLGRTSGRMFVATGEAGVSMLDSGRWINRGSHNPNIDWTPLADGAEGVFEDAAGRVWIGTNGVARWDPETDAFDLWDWRNTGVFGVDAFKYFGETPGGEIWAANRYSGIYRFDGQAWARLGLDVYYNKGIERDSLGNMWVAEWFEINRWDGVAWTTWQGPSQNDLFDLGGVNCVAVDPDDVIWLGTNGGLLRFDGSAWTLYDTVNSPLPTPQVQGIAFRPDGLMAVSTLDSDWPYTGGVIVIDGPIDEAGSWSSFMHGSSKLPHWQVGDVEFDAAGDLWVSATSEAIAVLKVGAPPCPADFNGDGEVNTQDVLAFLNAWGAGDPRGDFNGDGAVNTQDVLAFLNAWSAGC